MPGSCVRDLKVLSLKIASCLLVAWIIPATLITESVQAQPATKTQPKIYHGLKHLPPRVRDMVKAIHSVARSGHIEQMQEVLDMNELAPLTSKLGQTSDITNPIAEWKRRSADKDGSHILAQMLRALEAGYVKQTHDQYHTLYLWPSLAGVDLKTLTPSQKVLLFRLLPAKDALKTMTSGHYNGPRLGIGKDGTWHFFILGDTQDFSRPGDKK